MDLSLGVPLTGTKQKDFFKLLCGKNLHSLNLSSPIRKTIYDFLCTIKDDNAELIPPFHNPVVMKGGKLIKNTERSSCYRGVSRNGHLWQVSLTQFQISQVLIMNNKRKKYVGSFVDELDAALLYDKVAILTHGLKVYISIFINSQAKTNFAYRKPQIIEILKENINIE